MNEASKQLIGILEQVKSYVSDDSNMAWTGYESAVELRNEINGHITKIRNFDFENLDSLKTDFLVTCTFQEHSISNGWSEEFLKLASAFDEVYEEIKKNRRQLLLRDVEYRGLERGRTGDKIKSQLGDLEI